MGIRLLVALCCLVVAPVASVVAQTSQGVTRPAIAVIGTSSDSGSPRTLTGTGLPANALESVVLFDPDGGQSVLQVQTDASGQFTVTLSPPGGSWQSGVYRAAVPLPGSTSISTTFSLSRGGPALFAGPAMPSPTSAFILTGTGFPKDQTLDVVLTLASGFGDRNIQVSTDDSGEFTVFAWPQEFGFGFWYAGRYVLSVPAQGVSTIFWVREHPDTSALTVRGDPLSGDTAEIGFAEFAPGRYLWTVLADTAGRIIAQYLTGPTDFRGTAQATFSFPLTLSGTYLLATPYDWGETAFTVVLPTATPTETAVPTATSTAVPTATATARPRKTATARPRKTATARPRATGTKTAAKHSCKAHHGKKKRGCRIY
jgi:hypothetical protein